MAAQGFGYGPKNAWIILKPSNREHHAIIGKAHYRYG